MDSGVQKNESASNQGTSNETNNFKHIYKPGGSIQNVPNSNGQGPTVFQCKVDLSGIKPIPLQQRSSRDFSNSQQNDMKKSGVYPGVAGGPNNGKDPIVDMNFLQKTSFNFQAQDPINFDRKGTSISNFFQKRKPSFLNEQQGAEGDNMSINTRAKGVTSTINETNQNLDFNLQPNGHAKNLFQDQKAAIPRMDKHRSSISQMLGGNEIKATSIFGGNDVKKASIFGGISKNNTNFSYKNQEDNSVLNPTPQFVPPKMKATFSNSFQTQQFNQATPSTNAPQPVANRPRMTRLSSKNMANDCSFQSPMKDLVQPQIQAVNSLITGFYQPQVDQHMQHMMKKQGFPNPEQSYYPQQPIISKRRSKELIELEREAQNFLGAGSGAVARNDSLNLTTAQTRAQKGAQSGDAIVRQPSKRQQKAILKQQSNQMTESRRTFGANSSLQVTQSSNQQQYGGSSRGMSSGSMMNQNFDASGRQGLKVPGWQPGARKQGSRPAGPVEVEQELAETRAQLEAQYLDKAQNGRRMRKDPKQMEVLVEEFRKNPKWTYGDKIRIGAQIGMTHYQVAKWNWDYSKKLGVSTKRQKQQ